MEENYTMFQSPPRRRSRPAPFKETYLPYLILLAAIMVILIFIFGAIGRAEQPETPTAGMISTQSAEV